jgi:hypothetical protein
MLAVRAAAIFVGERLISRPVTVTIDGGQTSRTTGGVERRRLE